LSGSKNIGKEKKRADAKGGRPKDSQEGMRMKREQQPEGKGRKRLIEKQKKRGYKRLWM